jgi:hypothetical protein
VNGAMSDQKSEVADALRLLLVVVILARPV